jgi:hypothetical protein
LMSFLGRCCGAGAVALLCASSLFSQTFAPVKHYGPFTYTAQMQTGDFNRDGAADFVGLAYINNGTQTEVVVYMNSGTGTFSAPTILAGSTGAGAVAVGDFNQDGNLDIAFPTSQGVGVAHGNGNGTFVAPVFYTTNGIPNSIAVQDYNGDGKPDIATLSDSTHEVTILTNTGSAFTSTSFAVPLYYKSQGYSGDSIANLVAGDFNGNHKQDLAYVDYCTDPSCGPVGRIHTLINSGAGIYTPNLLPDVVNNFTQLTAADVDLDGKVDLVVFSEGAFYSAEAYVDYSNGNGSFSQVFMDDYQSSYGVPQSLVEGISTTTGSRTSPDIPKQMAMEIPTMASKYSLGRAAVPVLTFRCVILTQLFQKGDSPRASSMQIQPRYCVGGFDQPGDISKHNSVRKRSLRVPRQTRTAQLRASKRIDRRGDYSRVGRLQGRGAACAAHRVLGRRQESISGLPGLAEYLCNALRRNPPIVGCGR